MSALRLKDGGTSHAAKIAAEAASAPYEVHMIDWQFRYQKQSYLSWLEFWQLLTLSLVLILHSNRQWQVESTCNESSQHATARVHGRKDAAS